MYYVLKPSSPYRQLCLPLELIEKLASMNEDEVKVLLYLHAYAAKSAAEGFSQEELTKELADKGYDEERVKNALAYLRGAGWIEPESAKKKKKTATALPRAYYTAEQLSDAMDTSEDFRTIRDFAEKRLGKLFNPAELATLYSFLDSLKVSADVVMLVIEYCASENKGSLRYVEKMLADLWDKEITSYDAVEQHFANIREYKSYEGKIRSLCGLGSRALTKKEQSRVTHWLKDLKASSELLEAAYEKTIAAINKPSLDYMNTILDRWAQEGISSPEEARNEPKKPEEKVEKSYDVDDFFRAAVEKTRGKK